MEESQFEKPDRTETGLLVCSVITEFRDIPGEPKVVWSDTRILAKTLKDVEFILNFTGERYTDFPYRVDTVDASEMSYMFSSFDPRNN